MRKVVIVTGGTSGIGFAAARKFLEEHAVVGVASLDPQDIVDAAMLVLKKEGDADYHDLDVTDEKSCAKLVNDVINKYGRVDVLINAAGVRGQVGPPLKTDFADFEHTMQVNLSGTVRMSTITAGRMKEQGSGTIINISSISGTMVTAEDYGYHCSKSAVDMATKVLAREVSPFGVRCLAVAPGGVKTGMNSSDWEKQGAGLHIKERLIGAREAAEAIWLMTTDEASAINGSVLMMDDGCTAFKGIY